MKALTMVVAALAAGAALPRVARAQQAVVLQPTEHRLFTFLGSSLTVDVQSDAPGTVHVIHGQRGQVEVTARAANGFAGFGISDTRERLTLTSAGATRVDYLVVVPEQAAVRVRLPGAGAAQTFGTLERSASYSWKPPRPYGERAAEALPAPPAPSSGEAMLQPAYLAGMPPAVVSLPDASSLRALTVRWEGNSFRILGSRPISVPRPSAGRLALPPLEGPTSLAIVLPRDAREFRLEIQGRPALVIDAGRARVPCGSVVEQTLSGGRRWFTFSAGPDGVTCGR